MKTPEKKNVNSKGKKTATKKDKQAIRDSACCNYCRVGDWDSMPPSAKKELRGTGPRDEHK